jgi:hypothetical protein
MKNRERERKEPAKAVRVALTVAGVIAVILGTVGIFIPLLPTTPFLLLAAACFTRSSRRLYRWLMNHRWFGTYIRNYREHHAITRTTKILAITLLWSTIGYAVLAVTGSWIVRLLLIAIASGVTVHLLKLKTLTREMMQETDAAQAQNPSETESAAT